MYWAIFGVIVFLVGWIGIEIGVGIVWLFTIPVIGAHGKNLRDYAMMEITLRRERRGTRGRYASILDAPGMCSVPEALIAIIESYSVSVSDPGTIFSAKLVVGSAASIRATNAQMDLVLPIAIVVVKTVLGNGRVCLRAWLEVAHGNKLHIVKCGDYDPPNAPTKSSRVDFRGASADALAAGMLRFEAHRSDTGYWAKPYNAWYITDHITVDLLERALFSASFSRPSITPGDPAE